MANGDDALAAGMDILSGEDDRRNGWDEINKSRDYIATRIADAFLAVQNWAIGLFLPKSDAAAPGTVAAGKLVRYDGNTRIATSFPTLPAHAANKSYVDNAIASATPPTQLTDGGTFLRADGKNLGTTGDLFASGTAILSGATPAISGYTIAYIDGDGRVAKGASSESYKKHISNIDPASLGDIWPDLKRYQMRTGDGSWKYGYIAERLAESEDLAPFVVYADLGTGPIPDSIDFIALLIAQNAQLHQRLQALEARDA